MDSPIPRPDQRLNAPYRGSPFLDLTRDRMHRGSWVMNDANDKADVHPFRTDGTRKLSLGFATDGRTELGGGGVNAAALTQKGLYSPPSLPPCFNSFPRN